jgi:hypothetical protein
MSPDDTAVVGLRPAPSVITGDLSAEDAQAACAWAAKKLDALIAYWDGAIDTVQLGRMLRRV